jgi:carbon storage regulator
MLVLSRKVGESIMIGDNIRLTVVKVLGARALLGFTAPGDVAIKRHELCGDCAHRAGPSTHQPHQPARPTKAHPHARTPVAGVAPMPPLLRVATACRAALVTVLAQRLDEANVAAVGAALRRLADVPDRPDLRVDLGRVKYLTSAALEEFVALHRHVRAGGGQLTLENVAPLVYEVFEISRLTALFCVRPRVLGSAATVP